VRPSPQLPNRVSGSLRFSNAELEEGITWKPDVVQ
jgi:hypothetical protein